MRVSLFVTCLVDQLWPSIGEASVRLLRKAGCDVDFDPRQTCCGQPAFNSGYRNEARAVAQSLVSMYENNRADAIVLPSGSCTAMIQHLPELFEDDERAAARAREVADRTYELGWFLVRKLGLTDFGAAFRGKVTWHDACHGLRDVGIREEPRALLARVRGLELAESKHAEQCCGFGGTFSVKLPELSVAMADAKIEEIEKMNVRAVVSGDASCLMHLGGRLERAGSKVRAMHLAEVLTSAE